MTECIALLDELAYGPAGTEETKAAQTEWRARLLAGRQRMREQVRGRRGR
jgi:hypothetical protein